MAKETYSKTEIIKFTRKYGELEHEFEETTLEKRLKIIIEFLKSEKVQNVLEYKKDRNRGAYFYNHQMNFTRAKGAAYNRYDYNLIDVIFLSVMLSLFTKRPLKKLRQPSEFLTPDEESEWISLFLVTLNNFEELWNIENAQIEWEVVLVNLESLFYQLTLVHDVNLKANNIQKELYKVVELFEELTDLQKIEFYNTKLKSSIVGINKKFNSYVQNIKENNPDEYNIYQANQKLAKIDRQVEKRVDQSTSYEALLEMIRKQFGSINE